jgi:hypothetical protein
VLARMGAGRDVAGELADVIASLRRVDAKGMLAYTLACAAELSVERGDLAFAEDAAKEAAELAGLVQRKDTVARSRIVLSAIASARSDRDRAAAEVDAARAIAEEPLALSARTATKLARIAING